MREVCTLHSVGLLYPPSFAWLGGQMVQDTFNDNNTISLSHISYLFAISSQVMISFIAFEKEIRSRWCVLFFLPKRATSVCYPHHHCISTIHLKPPKKEKEKRVYESPSSGNITQKKSIGYCTKGGSNIVQLAFHSFIHLSSSSLPRKIEI